MSQAEKTIKIGFWFFLKPFLRRFPSSSQPIPKSPALLLLRPDRLGDFILSAPALTALLQQAGPSARVTLVAGEPNQQLAQLLFPKVRIWVVRKNLFSRVSLFIKLFLHRFDAVVDFHSYPFSTTSGLMTLASGSARRVGFVKFPEEEGRLEMIFNWGVPRPPESTHESQKSLLLVRRLYPGIKAPNLKNVFNLELERFESQVDEILYKAGVKPGDRLIGLHPTLLKVDNRWNPDHYRRLLRLFPARKGFKWLVLHGRGEETQLEAFKKSIEDPSGVFILPSCDLLQVLTAARRCSLVVAGDSGLTHACSLVTKVIALFGPSDPNRWGPLNLHHPLVLRSADLNCDSIQPEKVAAILKKVLIKR